jgi:hypothetical protein
MKIFVFVLLFVASNVHALEDWDFGITFSQMHKRYEEPGVMTERGRLPGYQFDVKYKGLEIIHLFFQYSQWAGHLEYDGATFAGTPLKQTTDDYVREYRALFYLNGPIFSPYLGYGQRYWRNDLVISYVRDTTYFYFPIGIEAKWLFFFFGAEYKSFLGGENKSFMSDTGGGRRDVKMDQENGRGYHLEAGVLIPIAMITTKVTLKYEKWNIEDSKTANDGVDTLVEPKNNSTLMSLNIGLIF